MIKYLRNIELKCFNNVDTAYGLLLFIVLFEFFLNNIKFVSFIFNMIKKIIGYFQSFKF